MVAQRQGMTTAVTKRRLWIDCTGIDHDTAVTGIPRTVLSHAKALAQLHAAGLSPFEPILVNVEQGGVLRLSSISLSRSRIRFGRVIGSVSAITVGAISFPFSMALRIFTRLLAMVADLHLPRSVDMFKRPVAIARSVSFRVSRRLWRGPSMSPSSGDVLLLPSHWYDRKPENFLSLQEKGVAICLFVHDILPVTTPEFYDSPWRDVFRRRLLTMIRASDATVTVSAFTLHEIERLASRRRVQFTCPRLVVHHGADIPASRSEAPRIDSSQLASLKLGKRPLLLIVGSIEPKKGHRYVIDTLDRLWDRAIPFDLVVVGRPGWKHERISELLRGHPEQGSQLHWLVGLDDSDLSTLYEIAHAVIFMSSAEGFGLPLIEAGLHGTQCVVSDIPVFREIADGSKSVTFVSINDGGMHLEQVIERIVTGPRESFAVPAYSQRTWRDAAQELSSFLEGIVVREHESIRAENGK
jgi:glycosyltransferase involved in cell wall biosynthesis